MRKNYKTVKYEGDASGLEIDFYLESILSSLPVVVNVGNEHSTYLSALINRSVHNYALSQDQYDWLKSHSELAVEAVRFRIRNASDELRADLVNELNMINSLCET